MGNKEIIYPVYKPSIYGNEKKYVNDCLDSSWISSKGEYIDKFEKAFAEFHGFNYATSVCNGTAALHIALLASGVTANDEVIVPTFTYVASVNAIAYIGAKPVFVDSLLDTWQMDPKDIESKITPRTKAIVVVHLYGHPCDMGLICEIAKKHKLEIIEDCAEAISARYKGSLVGSFGSAASFSFFGNKTITTGEGGMVASSRKDVIDRARHHKGQGLAEGKEYWHDVVGYNYRMTNICAAIGLAQLENVGKILDRKDQLAGWYRQRLKKLPVQFHDPVGDVRHGYWMISIRVDDRMERDSIRSSLREKGIDTRPSFPPVHTMPMYNDPGDFPVAVVLGDTGINLPSYPDLTEEDVDYVCKCIEQFYTDRG